MEEENAELPYVEMTIGEASYKTLLNAKFKMRKPYVPKNKKMIYGFIPGNIVKIFVKEGEKVKTGEKLLSLQAMKMNNIILSQMDGTVKKIHIQEGMVIVRDQLLIELK